MNGVCVDCSNGNYANSCSQGMRKVSGYFGRTYTYNTYIQSTIMKVVQKFLAIPVKVETGDNEVDKMLLGK